MKHTTENNAFTFYIKQRADALSPSHLLLKRGKYITKKKEKEKRRKREERGREKRRREDKEKEGKEERAKRENMRDENVRDEIECGKKIRFYYRR
jgi:hypothetical protein